MQGWVQDSESGLQSLRVDSQEETDFINEDFLLGFPGNVSFSVVSVCCNRKTEVVALDQKGNAGSCSVDLEGFLCSSNTYCSTSVEDQNLLAVVDDVEREEECKSYCSRYEGCSFYSWFSEFHNFPPCYPPSSSPAYFSPAVTTSRPVMSAFLVQHIANKYTFRTDLTDY